MEELQLILKDRIIDMCSLNETSLNPRIKVDIPGYHLVWKNRSTVRVGGVAFLIKSDINYNELGLSIQYNVYNIEYKAIIMNTSKVIDLIICTHYCPRAHAYKELINNLKTQLGNIILLGDFNAKHTS